MKLDVTTSHDHFFDDTNNDDENGTVENVFFFSYNDWTQFPSFVLYCLFVCTHNRSSIFSLVYSI
jgi:hypothetical protein